MLLGTLIGFTTGVHAAPQYRLVDWGNSTVEGYGISLIELNNANVAVGDTTRPGMSSEAVKYDGTTLQRLSPDAVSYARAINDSGAIALIRNMPDGNQHAFIYDDGLHDLGTASSQSGGRYDSSFILDINASGHAVGSSNVDGVFIQRHAVWYDGSNWHDINPPSGSYSDASAINNQGLIAGTAIMADGNTHAFTYDINDGSTRDIGFIGKYISAVNAINDNGQFVGQFATTTYDRAYLYDGTTLRDLGLLDGFARSSAKDINAAGYVVGNLEKATNSYGTSHAFLYDGSTMLDLNTLLIDNPNNVVLNWAIAINDQGNILARSGSHYYLLQSVPIPAAAWLLGSGLTGLACLGRRRLKRA